jgi:hypothetical protein
MDGWIGQLVNWPLQEWMHPYQQVRKGGEHVSAGVSVDLYKSFTELTHKKTQA